MMVPREQPDYVGVLMPQAETARQGAITHLAFLSLGKGAAIAFLNTNVPHLGGPPLAIATASEAGDAEVRASLLQLREHPRPRPSPVTYVRPSKASS